MQINFRKKYDVVWLGAFDSFWKLRTGLKTAIHDGVGFIHSGGRGSYHGGFGEGACLDFTSLADIFPVQIQNRYDLVLGQADERTTFFSLFAPIKGIQLAHDAEPTWNDGGLNAFGISGFNDTQLKPDAREILNIAGHPLLALGRYGQGRIRAFTGFTPSYHDQHAEWDANVIYPYLVDQELYSDNQSLLLSIYGTPGCSCCSVSSRI